MQCYRLRTTEFMENFQMFLAPWFGALGDFVDEIQFLHNLGSDPVGSHIACEQVVVRLAHQVRELELFEENLEQSVQEFIASLHIPPPNVVRIAESQRRDEFVYAFVHQSPARSRLTGREQRPRRRLLG